MLIALADFFSVSVDALLGYEIRNKDREDTVEQLKNDLKNNNFTDGSRRWEKAVKKYPNCFDVIYNSGNLYYIGGVDTKNKAWFGRAIELFLRAIDLIGQTAILKSANYLYEYGLRQFIYAWARQRRR